MHAMKLYIMALCAVKPDPDCMNVVEEGPGRIGFTARQRDGMSRSAPITVAPHADVAASPELAKEYGLERALEMWPREEGWVAHEVAITRVHQADMIELLNLISGETFEAEEREAADDDGWPDVI
jgi:hypothetical protein